jgi:hypothetical protein
MMKSCRAVFVGVLIPALMIMSMARTGDGALIPQDIETGQRASVSSPSAAPNVSSVRALRQAGLSAPEAAKRAQTMDRVELAQLQKSDLGQQGGDPSAITILAIVGAVALVIWLVRGMSADSDDDDIDLDID